MDAANILLIVPFLVVIILTAILIGAAIFDSDSDGDMTDIITSVEDGVENHVLTTTKKGESNALEYIAKMNGTVKQISYSGERSTSTVTILWTRTII